MTDYNIDDTDFTDGDPEDQLPGELDLDDSGQLVADHGDVLDADLSLGDDLDTQPDDTAWETACPCTVPADSGAIDLPGAEQWAPNGVLVLDLDGTRYELGIPTLDLDGNGVPESTIVAGQDGVQYLVTDLTGEGAADGLVLLDAAGNVLQGFEIGADGSVVPFEVPEGMNLADVVPADVATEPASVETTPTDPSVDEIGVAPENVADRDGGIGGNVVLEISPGELIDLGPATEDFDGDGVNESVIVPGEDGRPAYVVSEASYEGSGEVVLTLDPNTMQVTSTISYYEGQQVPDDQSGTVEDPTTTTDGPEKIIAPSASSGTASGTLATASVQGMYDVASEVWFELTGGQPYPRDENGQPLNPGMVFATLADTPGIPAETKDELIHLGDLWLDSVSVWIPND